MKKIYLYLDNAGSQDKKEVVKTYMTSLERDQNMIFVHQCPRSPENNILDLGVWINFKNVVEKQHVGCMKDTNCPAKTVDTAWTDLEQAKLENVWSRWSLVSDLIINDNGDNRLIELKKGNLFRAPPEEAEIIKNVLNGEEMDLNLLNNADINDYY